MRCTVPFLGSFLLLSLVACEKDTVATIEVGVSVEPPVVDFGPVWVGAVAERRVEVRNESRAPVELELRGPVPPFEGPPRVKLAVGQALLVPFRFRPANPGEAHATVALAGPLDEPIEIELSGVGVETVFSVAERLDFGGVRVGETVEGSLSVRNDGPLPLSPLRYELRGVDARAFEVARPVAELAPGASAEVGVRFEAGVLGDHRAQLVIVPCGTCDEARVELVGRGVDTDLAAEPERLDFPAVPPGGSSHLVLQVVNRGGYPASIEDLLLEGNAFAAERDALPAVLGEGEGIEIPVSFVPPGPGDFEGRLVLHGGEGEAVLEVWLRGHCGGPILAAEPPAIDLGRLPLGGRKGARLLIRNIGEEWPVELGSATIEGGVGWSVSTPPLPMAIEGPGLPIEVGIRGQEVGPTEATLVLAAADPAWERLRVPLRAEVVNDSCLLEVFPSPLRFGAIHLFSEDVLGIRSVSLTNRGADPCIVWDPHLDPDGDPSFSLTLYDPSWRQTEWAELKPGETARFEVELDWRAPVQERIGTTIHYRTSNVEDAERQVQVSALSTQEGIEPSESESFEVAVGGVIQKQIAVTHSPLVAYRLLSAAIVAGSAPEFSLSALPPLPHEFRRNTGVEVSFAPETPGWGFLGLLELEVEAIVGSPQTVVPMGEPLVVELWGRTDG